MNELISDLLDLSAMESSDVFMETFDLHDVLANEISYLSKQNKKRIGYKKKKVEINANFDDISLAVKNLIKNALKYSPPEENILIQVEENDKSVRCSFKTLVLEFLNQIKKKSLRDFIELIKEDQEK
jgi:signal transduction histidine kinase